MTELPPTKPPSVPDDDPLNEALKTKEKAELFPDSPVFRNAQVREHLDAIETEIVRERKRSDDQQDRRKDRIKDRFTAEGRVTFRIEGENVNQQLFSCNICRALTLKTGFDDHNDWHERMQGTWQSVRG